jgi:hypothetical protein
MALKKHMTQQPLLKMVLALVLAGFLLACAAEERPSVPIRHPQEDGEDLRFCLDCHDESDEYFPFRRFTHTPFFADDHRLAANQSRNVCSMCHQPSSCDACHGVGIELKPSRRDPMGTHRRTPHRGDYLSRHRIDGRMDPVSCRRCHGNPRTTATCRPCHG